MGSCASTSSVQEVKTAECRATGGPPARDKSNPPSACDEADNSEAGVPVAGAAPVNGWQDDDSTHCPGDARVLPAPCHEEPSLDTDESPLLSIPELTEEDNCLVGKPAAAPPPPTAAALTPSPAAAPALTAHAEQQQQRRSSSGSGSGSGSGSDGGVLGRPSPLQDSALSTSLPQTAERWQHPLVTIFLDSEHEEGEENGTIPLAIEECDTQRFFHGVKALEMLTDCTFFKGMCEGKHDTGSYKAKQQFRFWEHLHIPPHLALPLLARIKHCVDSIVFYLLRESLTAMHGCQVTCRTGVVQVLDEHGQASTEKVNVDELASNIVAIVNTSISMLERSKPLSKCRLTSSTTSTSTSHTSPPTLPSTDSKKKLKEERKPMSHAHLKKFVTNALYLLKYLAYGSALLSPNVPYLSYSNHPPVSHGDLEGMARAPRCSEEEPEAARPADTSASMILGRGMSLPPIRRVGHSASMRTAASAGRRASAEGDVELLPKHFYCFSVSALLTQCMRASQFVNPAEGMMGGRDVSEGLLAMYGVCKNLGLLVAKAPGVKVKVDAASSGWFATLPLYLLAPSVKADLLYLSCCESQFRLNVCVMRHRILDDVRQEVFRKSSWQGVSHRALHTVERWGGRRKQECGGFEAASSAGFWKISPMFRDEGARIERGEGHGPRKELFDLLADQTWAKYRHPLSLNKRCTATLHEGSAAVQLHWITKRCATEIPAWSKLSFGDSNDSFTSEVQSVEKTESCLWTVRLVNAATFSMKNVGVSLAARSDPLLLKEGVCTWFSQEEEYALDAEITEEQETRLQSWGLLGWMASQALGNGVSFNLGLPVVFYKLLLMWPKYNEEELLAGLKHTHFDLELTLEKIKALPEATFRDLLTAEGLGTMTVDEYVQQYVRDQLRNQIYPRMSAFVVGFRGSGVADLPVFASLRADELRLIIQGRSDDGLSNFYFRKEFIVTSPSEMFECQHNKIFQEILWEVVDGGFGAPTAQLQAERKREFLRFVTGRIYLPSHPQQEHLEICLPYTCFIAPEFSACTNRLPVAHTCENTLELPNYMEAVLFGHGGCYYEVSSRTEGAAILDAHKTEAWFLLSKETQSQVRKRIRELLTSKLMMAMQESNSYELDEHLTDSMIGSAIPTTLNKSATELSFTYPPEMTEMGTDAVETFDPSPPPPLPPAQPLSSSSSSRRLSANAAVASAPCDQPRLPTPPAKAKESPWERPKDSVQPAASLPDTVPAASPTPAAAVQSALVTCEIPAADASLDANACAEVSAQGPSFAGSKSAVTEGIGCLDWDDDSLLGTGRVDDEEASPQLAPLPQYTPTPPPQPTQPPGKTNGVDSLLAGRHLSFGAAEMSSNNNNGDGLLKDGVYTSVIDQFSGVNDCTIMGAVPLDQTKATDPWDTEDLDDLLNNLHNL